jgi:hypothetical protein
MRLYESIVVYKMKILYMNSFQDTDQIIECLDQAF